MAGGLRHRGVAAFVQRHFAARLGEHQRLPSAGNAGADDADGRGSEYAKLRLIHLSVPSPA